MKHAACFCGCIHTMAVSIPSTSERAAPMVAPAAEYDVALLQTSISQRQTVKRPFEGPTTGAPNTTYILKGPHQGSLHDWSSAVIRLDNVQATVSAGVQPRFQDGPTVGLLISQATLRIGGKTIVTLQDVGLHLSIQNDLRGAPYSSAGDVYGFATAALRQTWSTQARSYELPLSALFSGIVHYPMSFGDYEIELLMANAVDPLEATGATTAPTWSFNASRSYFQVDILTLKSPVNIPMLRIDGWKASRFNVTAGTNQFDAVVPIRAHNLRSVWWVERPTATLATVTTLNRLHHYPVNGATDKQWQAFVDDDPHPREPIIMTGVTDTYEAFKSSILHHGSGFKMSGVSPLSGAIEDSTLITASQFEGTHPSGVSKNIICLDMSRSDPTDGVLSSINTVSSSSQTRLMLRYGGAGATAATTGSLFCNIDVVIRRTNGGLLVES